MIIDDVLRLLEIALWPVVALVAILVVRPHLGALLSGAKVKLTLHGVTLETTLPELRHLLEEQAGEALSTKQENYLASLQSGNRGYPGGIRDTNERKFLRPLRNSGLILAVPRNAFLEDATEIELSALGRLYLRAKRPAPKDGT